jgi:CubicO group peptidase (beta-lactamase class C family)
VSTLIKKHIPNYIEQKLIKEGSSRLNPLFTYVKGVQQQISASAAAVYVIQKDKVIGEWYAGFINPSQQKVKEDSRFNVYSVRKSYIGLVTAIAKSEVRIKSLDDYASDYLDGEDKRMIEGIKIRHLVTHTHGLEFKEDRLIKMYAPGTGWDYNGAGLSLLYKIILHTTGKTVSEIIQEKVFKPLGFQETGWETTYKSNLVYDVFENSTDSKLRFEDETGFERNLYVSARELAHWGYLHLKKGVIQGTQVLSPSIFEQTTSIQTPCELRNTPQNGYFWFQNENRFERSELGESLPKGAYQILGASGCTVLVIPEFDAVAVRMYNKVGNPPGYDYLRDIKNFGNLVYELLKV